MREVFQAWFWEMNSKEVNLIKPPKYLLKHEKRRKHSKVSILYQDQ